jgi:hypothetical protein
MSDWCAWIENNAKEVLKVLDKPQISVKEAMQITNYAIEMLIKKRGL